MTHFLNLLHLADEDVDQYALLSFEGREAISECFDYRIELITAAEPDLTRWIGKLCEFNVSRLEIEPRVFAGRIYAAHRILSDGSPRILVHVGPALKAMAYARATHFVQDKTCIEIFDAMRTDVPGLVPTKKTLSPKVRGYAVRYDESELNFLERLFAQDGIMYFFVYDARGGDIYRHRMVVTSAPGDYIDVVSGPAVFADESHAYDIAQLQRNFGAGPRSHKHVSFNVRKLDTPLVQEGPSPDQSWGSVYPHPQETIGYEAVEEADVIARQTANDYWEAQRADHIEGKAIEPSFMAGGRVEIQDGPSHFPRKIVLTSVTHSAIDPWMLGNTGASHPEYSNTFTAIDATRAYRPQVGRPERLAPGPLLGVVDDEGATVGDVKVDDFARVPVAISNARDYSPKGLKKYVWLPVKQQWAHGPEGTFGSQFFPRIGTRVIIEFLYGNPDLPFISGTMFNESQKYPYNTERSDDDEETRTTSWAQSGWRTATVKTGDIKQEFRFDDKAGAEEIYLYTGRDYRRFIDRNDYGTIKGLQELEVRETRTLTVREKSLHESDEEIQLKVGTSTITITQTSIDISADKITIGANQTLDMSADGKATFSAPILDTTAYATLTLKGGIVKIN